MSNINLHIKNENSFPNFIDSDQNDELDFGDLGIIENVNFNRTIRLLIDNNIQEIIDLILESKDNNFDIIDGLQLESYNDTINSYFNENDIEEYTGIMTAQNGTNFTPNKIIPHRNNIRYQSMVEKANNNLRYLLHPNALDEADNIIDTKRLTYFGGSRRMHIRDELINHFTNNQRMDNSNPPQGITDSHGDNVNDVWTNQNLLDQNLLGGHNFNFVVIDTLFKLPTNSQNELETKIQTILRFKNDGTPNNFFNNQDIYRYISKLICSKNKRIDNNLFLRFRTILNLTGFLKILNKRIDLNIGHFFHTLISKILCLPNRKYISNLEGDIPQRFIMLSAALINLNTSGSQEDYRNNLDLSLHQACKTYYIDHLITRSNDNKANVFRKWIIFLFTKRTISGTTNPMTILMGRIPSENDDLILLAENVQEYFEENDIDRLREYSELGEKFEKLNKSEILSHCIMKYYNSMKQSPLLQNVVDTISIIRCYQYIRKGDVYNQDQAQDICLTKLRNMYVYANYNNDPNLMENIEMPLQFYNWNDYHDIDTKIVFNLTHNIEPSKIYFDINRIKINKELLSQTVKKSKKYFNIAKYIESSNLGLQYLGFLNIEESIKFKNKQYFIKNNQNDIPTDYLGLNYMYDNWIPNGVVGGARKYNSTDNSVINNFYNLYTGFGRSNNTNGNKNDILDFRPPTNNNFINTNNMMIEYFYTLQQKVLNEGHNTRLYAVFRDLLETRDNEEYGNIVPFYYPILQALNEHTNFFYENYSNETKQGLENTGILGNYPNLFNFNRFVKLLNSLNANIFLYYYIRTNEDKKVRVPKFFYYLLPENKEIQSNYLIFNQKDDTEVLPRENYDGTNDGETGEDDIIEKENYGYFLNFRNDGYKNFISNFEKGIFTTEEYIQNEAFVLSKGSKLPPSFYINLNNFYFINIIKIIKEKTIELLDNDDIKESLDKIVINPDNSFSTKNMNARKALTIAKTIEELIKMFLKDKINRISDEVFSKTLNLSGYRDGRFDEEIKDIDIYNLLDEEVDFDKKLDENDVTILENFIANNTISKEMSISLYKFSDNIVKKKNVHSFVNFPCNYSSINLTKMLYKIDVNTKIFSRLIKQGNLNVKNIEQKTPLYNLIKNLDYELLQKVKKDGNLDLREEYFNMENVSPLQYLLDHYKNHTNLFVTDTDNYKDFIEQFVSNQYQEIEEIIYANDDFRNNILKNLKNSFNICCYITLQFISENFQKGHNLEFSVNLDKILKLIKYNDKEININDLTNFTILDYEKILENKLPEKDEHIIKNEMIDEFTKQKNKLINKFNLLINDSGDKTVAEKRFRIQREINRITRIISKLERIKSNKRSLFNNLKSKKFKIIERYNRMLMFEINTKRSIYMYGWNMLINKLNKNKYCQDIIPLILLDIESNLDLHNTQQFLEKINYLSIYYKAIGDYVSTYFTNERYTENNKILEFTKDLLVHLTENTICNGLEIIIKKILFQELSQKASTNDILKLSNRILLRMHKIGEKLYDNEKSIAEKLVINAVKIFKNKNEEAEHVEETTEEILKVFFEYLENVKIPVKLSENVMKILNGIILQYFDTITAKIINNWNVVIENVFMFIINQGRYVNTIKEILAN